MSDGFIGAARMRTYSWSALGGSNGVSTMLIWKGYGRVGESGTLTPFQENHADGIWQSAMISNMSKRSCSWCDDWNDGTGGRTSTTFTGSTNLDQSRRLNLSHRKNDQRNRFRCSAWSHQWFFPCWISISVHKNERIPFKVNLENYVHFQR